MSDNDKLIMIEKKLDEHGSTLKEIQRAINQMAVQDQKISEMQTQISSLWRKYDDLCGPEGVVLSVRQFQAGCPRNQVKFLWVTNISLSVLMIGIGVKLIGG